MDINSHVNVTIDSQRKIAHTFFRSICQKMTLFEVANISDFFRFQFLVVIV